MRWDEGIRQKDSIHAHLKRFGPASGVELKQATGCKQSMISALRRDGTIAIHPEDQKYHLVPEKGV